ncbi:MAG: EamA family transporter [Methanosphaera sp.]|nr:EamA family transporter [Methanosphaera sp.]
MFNMLIPIAMVVISNCIYHICSKSMPNNVNTFGALMVTYLTGAIVSGVIFLYMVKSENALIEMAKINFTSIVLGLAIVGLEAGYIYAYRVGWQVNNAPLVANTGTVLALVIIGAILFNEGVTLKQIAGMILCIVGLIFISL